MTRRHEAGRSRPHILLVLVVASVTLLTLDFRDVGPFGSLQTTAQDVLNPLRSAGESAFGPVTDAWQNVFSGGGSSGELDELRAENARLRNELIAQDNAEDLLAAALLQLDIPYVGNEDRVVARVVAGSVGNFDDFHIEINKGSSDGIKPNMPVVSGGGLIGRVEEVARHRSRVVLIIDPEFAVGIRVVGSDEELAIAEGNGARNGSPLPLRVTEDVSPRVVIEVGSGVVTSGLDNSLYPPDIPVGFISEVRLDEGALTQVLEIEPSGDLATLRFVTVVLFEAEDPNDDGGLSEEAPTVDDSTDTEVTDDEATS